MNALEEALAVAKARMPGWAYLAISGDVHKAYSREYLEEALSAARQHLPGWAYAMVHRHAMPRAGGRVKNAPKPEPAKANAVERAGIRAMASADLKEAPEADLLAAWGQLQSWYHGEPDDDLFSAAGAVLGELERRGVACDRECQLAADAAQRKQTDAA